MNSVIDNICTIFSFCDPIRSIIAILKLGVFICSIGLCWAAIKVHIAACELHKFSVENAKFFKNNHSSKDDKEKI